MEAEKIIEEGTEAEKVIEGEGSKVDETNEDTNAAETKAENEALKGDLDSVVDQIDNDPAGTTADEGKTTKESYQEGEKEAKEELESGKDKGKLRKIAEEMWNNKGAFAKQMGVEFAKGVAFNAGSILAEDALVKIMSIVSPSTSNQGSTPAATPDPQVQRALNVVKAIQAERAQTGAIVTSWQTWMTNHFDDQKKYGHTDGAFPVSYFTAIASQIVDVQKIGTTDMKKFVDAVKATPTTDTTNALLTNEKSYIDKLIALANTVTKEAPLMVKGGFDPQIDQLQSAEATLNI